MRVSLLFLILFSVISCSSDRKTTVPDKPGAGATAVQAEMEQSADYINNNSTPVNTTAPVGTPAIVPVPPKTKKK